MIYRQFGDRIEIYRPVGTKLKRRLPTFANDKKVVTVKIRNQLLNIKAESKRVKIYNARSRRNVDLPGYLGKYEFSAAPISIFTEEGDLIRSKDKSKFFSEVLDCLRIEVIAEESAGSDYKVIVYGERKRK